MSDDDRDNVIAKVLKLLAMAAEDGGASENERMIAAERAQKLMLEHQIETLDLEAKTGAGPTFDERHEDLMGENLHWRIDLYTAIGDVTNVSVHYLTDRGQRRWRRAVLIGRPEAIEFTWHLADSLIPWLERECEQALQANLADPLQVCGKCRGWGCAFDHGVPLLTVVCSRCKGTAYAAVPTRIFRRSFYLAAAARIGERLKEQRDRLEEASGSMELVVNDRKALDDYMAEHHDDMQDANSRAEHDAKALALGALAGGRASLTGELEGASDAA